MVHLSMSISVQQRQIKKGKWRGAAEVRARANEPDLSQGKLVPGRSVSPSTAACLA